MDQHNTSYSSKHNPTPQSGPFLARVISHLDQSYMGSLEVELLHQGSGNISSETEVHKVRYMSPFFGMTSVKFNGSNDTFDDTQKSYGMWMIPPDYGSTVIVIFIEGDPRYGYWIGCVPDENMNFMVPGLASTSTTNEKSNDVRKPTAEYNKNIESNVVANAADPTLTPKPVHPISNVFEKQGLLSDDIRGITTSSARRETPSSVFGISTPGPLDKNINAKRGKIDKLEHQVNTFVSRLGGTTLVMDDGDDKFLRKDFASKSPPDYASIEQGNTGGNVNIPHNELFRIRTRTGHQILMHNSEDLIYISNASGTSWIEFTSNGKIDIFANDSISIHTNKDFNFHADRDINFEAVRNINMKSGNNTHIESTNMNLVIGQNGIISAVNMNINGSSSNKISSGGNLEFNAGGNLIQSASVIYSNNGPTAGTASTTNTLSTHSLIKEDNTTFNSILCRVPTHEPYPQHENLDPVKFSSDNLDRDKNIDLSKPAASWKQYTTKTDTFRKIKE